jgi:hypothetical protein
MSFVEKLFSSRGTRAAVGGAMVADGLVGIDVPSGRKRVGIFGSLLILAIGVVFVIAGLYVRHQDQPYPGGITTTASVTDVRNVVNKKGHTVYSRVFTFTSADGRKVSVTESSTSTTRPTIGDAVEVSYRKGDADGARIINDKSWLSLLIIGVGGLTAVLGLGTFLIRLVTLITGSTLLSRALRDRN